MVFGSLNGVALSESDGMCVFEDKFDVQYGTCPEDDLSCRCPIDDSGGETFTKVRSTESSFKGPKKHVKGVFFT